MKSSAQIKQDLEPAVVSDQSTGGQTMGLRAATRTHPADAEDFPAYDTTVISGDTARMLKTLLGNLDGMVYRCRNDGDWTMEFISEGCHRLTGYEVSELLLNNRLSYESITHPDDRKRVHEE